MKTHVIILSPQIYPCKTGGVEVFNYHLSHSLAKRGVQVNVITSCKKLRSNSNLRVTHLKTQYPLDLIEILYHLLKMSKKQKTVVYLPYTSNSPYIIPVYLASKITGLKYLISIHGGGLYPWRPYFLHYLGFKQASSIVGVSYRIVKEYSHRAHRKVRLIFPTPSFKESREQRKVLRKKYNIKEDDVIVLYVGSLKKIKGTDLLIKALAQLGPGFLEEHKIKLLIVGSGPMCKTLKALTERGKIEKYVYFIGRMPNEIVHEFYEIADIYVIPSYFEGMPISLLEALFHNIPAIVADSPGIREITKDRWNALVFKQGDFMDLASKIKEMIENKKVQKKLKHNSRKSILKYLHENVIREYLEEFHTTLEGVRK